MSLESNTTALQEILDMVNALPDSGGSSDDPGDSGDTGVTVQRSAGTIKTNSQGTASAGCGFKPDLVFLHHNEKDPDDGLLYNVAVSFTEETRTGAEGKHPYVAMWSGTGIYSLYVQQWNDGFYIQAWKYDDDWNSSNASSTTFNYVAIKYT